MFVREVAKPNGSVSIRIVESVRCGEKITQKTVRTLGQHKDPKEIEVIRKAAAQLIVEISNNRNPVLDFFDPADFYVAKKRKKQIEQPGNQEPVTVSAGGLKEECRYNDGIYDVFGSLYEQLGFDKIICDTKQDDKWNETLEACVLARVAQPSSKKKTVSILEEQFDIKIDLDHVYRMMDHVYRLEDQIKTCVARQTMSLFKKKVTDKQEIQIYHTDPLKSDTDGDGLSHYKEIQLGRDSLNPVG